MRASCSQSAVSGLLEIFKTLSEFNRIQKFTNLISDSTLQLNFKKLLLFKSWCSIKEYSHLSEKATKILLTQFIYVKPSILPIPQAKHVTTD